VCRENPAQELLLNPKSHVADAGFKYFEASAAPNFFARKLDHGRGGI
jgi:hypothetical protein